MVVAFESFDDLQNDYYRQQENKDSEMLSRIYQILNENNWLFYLTPMVYQTFTNTVFLLSTKGLDEWVSTPLPVPA